MFTKSNHDLCSMTVKEFEKELTERLAGVYDKSEAAAVSRFFVREVAGNVSEVNDDQKSSFEPQIARLLKGEPVQYVVGFAWFHDLKIEVNASVLIPRPETEELLSIIKNEAEVKPHHILDVCCGSGCIALVLKKFYPEAEVEACDFSFDALQTAKNNSTTLNLAVSYFWTDVLEADWISSTDKKYDFIVSNPPYIMRAEAANMHKNVLNFEPQDALFTGEDALEFYKSIGEAALKLLQPKGELWFEINPLRADETALMLEEKGFNDVRIYADISGKERFVRAVKII